MPRARSTASQENKLSILHYLCSCLLNSRFTYPPNITNYSTCELFPATLNRVKGERQEGPISPPQRVGKAEQREYSGTSQVCREGVRHSEVNINHGSIGS